MNKRDASPSSQRKGGGGEREREREGRRGERETERGVEGDN